MNPGPAAAASGPAPRLGAFGALWFFYFAAIGAFAPFAPLWFRDLGFSTLAIGTIASLQAWARVLAPFGWGWLGDRGGRRVALLRVAAALSVAAALGLLWTRGYGAVALCTALLFLANGGVVPLAEATLSRHLSTATGVDSARYGRVRVWGSVGFIVAVLLCGALLDRVGIGHFPWLLLGVYLLVFAAALRLPGGSDHGHGHEAAPPLASVLRRTEVRWFFASVFFTVLAHTSLYTFFSLFLDERGHGEAVVGGLWAVSVAVEIVFFWWQGRIFDRAPPHVWLQWAAAISVLRFAMTALFGGQIVLLALAQSLHVVTFAAQHAACIHLVARHFPGPLRGRGQALYSVLGYGASGVVGGVAGGWLSSRWGITSVFWAASVSAAVGWWCATRSRRAAAAHPAIR